MAGSAWMALSYSFVDYCIWGWSNLPRTVLMYYSNFISSPEGYFHTVICNAKEFINTTVNHDLHFISWDNPPKQHPHYLTISDFSNMVESNLPFARKFHADDPVLDMIDTELLHRHPGMLVPGGWCIGPKENSTDPCSVVGNTTDLRPGPGAKKLESLLSALLSEDKFHPRQCLTETDGYLFWQRRLVVFLGSDSCMSVCLALFFDGSSYALDQGKWRRSGCDIDANIRE
ncbi:Beta-glucuronosyltransferase GlcAT14A [Asimina triloba]